MKKLVLLLILSVFLLTACGSEQDAITEDTEDTAIKDTVSFEQEKQYIDTGRFISPEDFNHSIKTYQQQIEIDFVPRIAVAPHHTVAAELTAQCFSYLPQDTETVIILAPNHLNNGKQIMTTDASFTSLAGTVDADTEAISALVKDGALSYAENQFSTEHSRTMTSMATGWFLLSLASVEDPMPARFLRSIFFIPRSIMTFHNLL